MKKLIWPKIAKDISLQVSLGRWPVGSIIPTEKELAEHYKVGRDTIRRALAELTASGLFERKPHIGTRVKSKNRAGKFFHELGDIKAIDRYGNTYPRKVQKVEEVYLEDAKAEALGFPRSSKVIRFENIRIASEETPKPVVMTLVYIFPDAKDVLNLVKIYPAELIVSLAEQVSGRECVEVRQIFSATPMPEAAAHYFDLPVGSPSLKIVRQYLDEWGRTIVASESFHPADKFSFAISAKKRLDKNIYG